MSEAPVSTRPHVVVVGGGIAGLAAALEVLDGSPTAQVTVLEAGERVGGKLRLEEVAGHRVDVGAESVLATRPETVTLARRAGVPEEDLVAPATTSASIWSRGALHPMPRATLMGIPTDPSAALGILTEAEVSRAAHERPWPAGPLTDDVAVGEYVGARLGRAVVDRLVEPLLGGVYAGHADRLSLRATMPALWQRAAGDESLLTPVPPPSPSAGARSPFAGLRGGFGRLPGLLADVLRSRGAQVRTGTVVRGLERSGDRWRVVVGSAADPGAVLADAVVLAVPPGPAGRLLDPHAPEAARILSRVETASMAVVTLAVRRDGLGALPGSGFLVPPVEGRAVKASTFSFAKWGWVGALSPEVVHLRASLGRLGDEAVLQRDDADLVTLAVAEVGEVLGAPLSPVVDSHVQRWGGGLPQYAVGHVDAVATVRAGVARLPGVEVAGATYDGVGVAAVVASGLAAARATTDHLRTLAASQGAAR